MFIEVKIVPSIKKKSRNPHQFKKLLVCACDECGEIFERKYHAKQHERIINGLTFCSRACTNAARKKGKPLQQQITNNRDNEAWYSTAMQTLFEKHGVENPGQLPDHFEKCQTTLMKNYNVDCVMKIPAVRNVLNATAHTTNVNERRDATNLKRYGHKNLFKSKIIQQRIQQKLMQKYNVIHSSYIPGIAFKRQETMKRNGTINNFAREDFKAKYTHNPEWHRERVKKRHENGSFRLAAQKAVETSRKNGSYEKGVIKRHNTMKSQGQYTTGISQEEHQFYQKLLEIFEVTDIERQKLINGWTIDFYIFSLNAYIQYDGVYWHGLDRPIEEIMLHRTARDKTIHRTWTTDQKQNEWFTSNGLKLIRFRSDEKFNDLKNWISKTSP